jgi:hypothetical protein
MMTFSPKITAFLSAIQIMPIVMRAAQAAGINRSLHYAKLQSDPEYAQAFEAALRIGYDAVSDIAVERATFGWQEPIVYDQVDVAR